MRDALVRIAGDRRAAARADRPGRVAVLLPQQDGVLVHAHGGRARARPAPRRPLGRGARHREVLAHHRPRQRDPRDACDAWAREERLEAYDQEDGTGYLRHLVIREGRNTGQALVQLVTAKGERFERDYFVEALQRFPRGALDPLGGQRHAGRDHEPADRAALGRGRDRGGAVRPALPRAAERVPADEHARWPSGSTSWPREAAGADRQRDGLGPLLRHRHDRALDGRATR